MLGKLFEKLTGPKKSEEELGEEFARTNSGADLIQKLKHAGHYPYSEMDREAVV